MIFFSTKWCGTEHVSVDIFWMHVRTWNISLNLTYKFVSTWIYIFIYVCLTRLSVWCNCIDSISIPISMENFEKLWTVSQNRGTCGIGMFSLDKSSSDPPIRLTDWFYTTFWQTNTHYYCAVHVVTSGYQFVWFNMYFDVKNHTDILRVHIKLFHNASNTPAKSRRKNGSLWSGCGNVSLSPIYIHSTKVMWELFFWMKFVSTFSQSFDTWEKKKNTVNLFDAILRKFISVPKST